MILGYSVYSSMLSTHMQICVNFMVNMKSYYITTKIYLLQSFSSHLYVLTRRYM